MAACPLVSHASCVFHGIVSFIKPDIPDTFRTRFPDTFRNGSWTNRTYNIGSNHRRPLDKDTCDLQMPM